MLGRGDGARGGSKGLPDLCRGGAASLPRLVPCLARNREEVQKGQKRDNEQSRREGTSMAKKTKKEDRKEKGKKDKRDV